MNAECSPFSKRIYSMIRGSYRFLAVQLSYVCILYILPVDYVEDQKDSKSNWSHLLMREI
jgi:hypothetical protein